MGDERERYVAEPAVSYSSRKTVNVGETRWLTQSSQERMVQVCPAESVAGGVGLICSGRREVMQQPRLRIDTGVRYLSPPAQDSPCYIATRLSTPRATLSGRRRVGSLVSGQMPGS